MNKHTIINSIEKNKIIAIIRAEDTENILKVAEALLKGGINTIEVSFNTPNALDCIEAILIEFKKEVIIGAGTVLDGINAVNAINSGAQFIVSPIFKNEIISTCSRYGVVSVPGVLTPNEAVNAYNSGADFIKIFPAGSLGPSYIKAIRAPLPQLRVIAVGGVDLKNAKDFLDNGAVALAIGSSLVSSNAINSGDYETIKKNAEDLMNSIIEN